MAWRWPAAEPLTSARLALEPLTVAHAEAMVAVLAHDELYVFTGGHPPSFDELRSRYQRQAVGRSPTGDSGWLNWVIRDTGTGVLIGYIQATLTHESESLAATMAWLVAPSHQHAGLATEAAISAAHWLGEHGVTFLRAHVHPDHLTSAMVAQRLGLAPSSAAIDGEIVWEALLDTP